MLLHQKILVTILVALIKPPMQFSGTDFTINVILLIFSGLLLFIPLVWDIRKIKEIKDRKGKVIRTEKGGISTYGIIFFVIIGLSLSFGIWKLIRDGKTTQSIERLQTSNLNATNELKDTIASYQARLENSNLQQFKKDSSNFTHNFNEFIKQLNNQDSIRFVRLQNQLKPRGLNLDSRWNLTSLSNPSNYVGIYVENGAHDNIIKDNKFIIAPKKVQ